MASVDALTALFQAIGLTEQKSKEAAGNKKLAPNLEAAIREVRTEHKRERAWDLATDWPWTCFPSDRADCLMEHQKPRARCCTRSHRRSQRTPYRILL